MRVIHTSAHGEVLAPDLCWDPQGIRGVGLHRTSALPPLHPTLSLHTWLSVLTIPIFSQLLEHTRLCTA